MDDIDFPEYGQQCELKEPWRGYHRGTIVGRNGFRYIVEFSSGARIELYEDEIEFDVIGNFVSTKIRKVKST